MAVPTFIQSKTAASDSSAGTTHPITLDNSVRQRGGAISPSTLVLVISYDGNTGNLVSGVTDTNGNTWQRGTSISNGAGVNGEMWYALNCNGGLAAPTITATTSSSVKAKLAAAELDQIAPISPLDGTSTSLDKTQERIDVTNSAIRTSSPASPVPPRLTGQIEVRMGAIAWNDTRTVSSTSAWTGLVQLSGTASNLGVAIERKASEIKNTNAGNSRASFTMNSSGTVPAGVMSLSFFRDGVITSTDEDGYIDNIEGVATAITNVSPDFVYRSSASAPIGGTGASEYSQAFSFFPRYYKLDGVTIADAIEWRFVVNDGFDDGAGYFAFYCHTFKSGQLGSTLTTADENTAADRGNIALGVDANLTGEKSIALSKALDFNETGVTAIKITQEGDGLGSSTSNYMNITEFQGNVPQYMILTLTYPPGSASAMIVG